MKAVHEKEFDIANNSMEFLSLDVLEPDFDGFIDMINVAAAAEFCKVADLKGIAGRLWRKTKMLLDFTTMLGSVGMKNCSYLFLLVRISSLLVILFGLVLSFKRMPDRTESGQVCKKSCGYSKIDVNKLVVYLNQDDVSPRKQRRINEL